MLQKHIPVALALLLCMTGCSTKNMSGTSKQLESNQVQPNQYTDAKVYQDLLAATEASQANLVMLRKIKQGSGQWPARLETAEPPPSSPMSKKITLTWHGPIESVVHVLASAVQYKVTITGKPPVQPVMVSMDAVDENVYKVIENIGWQTGNDVALVRDDRRRELKVIYKES